MGRRPAKINLIIESPFWWEYSYCFLVFHKLFSVHEAHYTAKLSASKPSVTLNSDFSLPEVLISFSWNVVLGTPALKLRVLLVRHEGSWTMLYIWWIIVLGNEPQKSVFFNISHRLFQFTLILIVLGAHKNGIIS